ncbi:MAG: transcription-repair coupling factor [Sulfuricellaceae bacterium]|jgi:transcription-repair coupling factor (superfamily II helicase)
MYSLPLPGQRLRLSQPRGSADALLLSRLAEQARPLVIVTATAQDARRLREEIPWFAPALSVHLLPDWETLPYDQFSPHHDLVSERLATLYQIMRRQCDVVIAPLTTTLYRLAPVEYLAAHTFFLKKGQKLDLDALRGQMTVAGYHHVSQVYSPGEYSVRGGLIDLFPMGSPVPYRLDLFGDEIESIRTFDVDTQRSIYPVNDIRLLPAREFPLDEEGIKHFRQKFRESFEGDPSKSRLYKDVSNGIPAGGIEYYLPLFFDATATLFDYLPEEAALCLHGDLMEAVQGFWQDTQSRHRLLSGDRDRPLLPPKDLFLPPDDFFAALKPYARVELSAAHGDESASQPLPPLQVDRRADNPLARLRAFLDGFGGRVLITAESLGRRETMHQYFAEYGLKPVLCDDFAAFQTSGERFMLAAAPLHGGFIIPHSSLLTPHEPTAFITEAELYAQEARPARAKEAKTRPASEGMLRDLSEIKAGDPVVHEQHGIGRYLGLSSMDLGDGVAEFLTLEYAGGDKLYVPVSQLHLISRYYGSADEGAPLHKLGSGQWEKAKKKAMKQVWDTAAELLNLYARRAARQGHAFQFSHHDYEAFAAGFGFEETPDQAAAIQAVLEDMASGRPMDRLVCGDVGFGKTEVALRAAFAAVAGGKQVAVLVPTTLLAEQHFQTFSDRFADWPVKIAELSRFRSAKEQSEALKGIAEGKLDILIGTHKLIQKDVKFANLGLVIIDEEHRFGVRQKERLKALRAEVDVLTLTATPIPRTLAMAMEGLREFSVIATAPQKRLAIKTFVSKYSDGVIREAVLRELKRGGQVYFLHNEVDTIQNQADKLARLLPEARIAIAHGQMGERDLERVMRDFYHQRFNLLVCTTIIETGIHVPSANTILINRADRFGLAQLHQLRGRVGRSHHQAYAYLLTHGEDALTAQAKKRLEAIQALEELGSGFYLAMHDLEIRGAGEVLGESQSGEMQEVGFSLFTEMLAHAVASLKVGKEPDLAEPLHAVTDINLRVPALLPEDYCGDVHERLVLYKRLAHCDSLDELKTIQEELVDRFGLLPPEARALLDTHRLRLLAKPLGIVKIDAAADNLLVQFVPNPPIDPARIIRLIQQKPGCKLAGPDRLRLTADMPEVQDRVGNITALLKELT